MMLYSTTLRPKKKAPDINFSPLCKSFCATEGIEEARNLLRVSVEPTKFYPGGLPSLCFLRMEIRIWDILITVMIMMRSVWENQLLPGFEALQGKAKTHVLIIGGGITGILCAKALQDAGQDYILLETNRLCGGVTGKTTAKITAQHGLIYAKLLDRSPEIALAYLRANLEALEEYRQLCKTVPCGFEEKPSYIYTTGQPQQIEAELQALQQLRFPAEYAWKLPVPLSTQGAVMFPNQAQFHPLAFLSHIARDLKIYEHSPVRQLTKTSAILDGGEVEFDKLIVATHFPFLNKHGLYFMKLYQQRSYVISLANGPQVDGMYMGDTERSLSLRNFGTELLLGGGGHRTGKAGEGWKPLLKLAQKKYPGCPVTHRWATQDCMSLDGMPYIGQYSLRTPNVYVATGFNKWGMTWSMAASRMLCDAVLGRENPYLPFFSPSRSMLTAQLGMNLWESSASLLSFGGRRCPHMGCKLKWNSQERSWDCPCHGSRFTAHGKLLDNPSTGDLKK